MNLDKSTVLWTLAVLQRTAPFIIRLHIEASGLKGTLTHATRMNLDDVMLGKISQSQKCKYYMIPII